MSHPTGAEVNKIRVSFEMSCGHTWNFRISEDTTRFGGFIGSALIGYSGKNLEELLEKMGWSKLEDPTHGEIIWECLTGGDPHE